MKEKPFVISMHHRCGSKWISGLLSGITAELGITRTPVETTRHFSKHTYLVNFPNLDEVKTELAFIANCNYNYLPIGIKGINIYRDPRDQLVSCYFSHRNSHQDEFWPQLAIHRKKLKGLNEEDGILEEMNFSHEFIQDLGSFDLGDENFEHFDLIKIGKNRNSIMLFVVKFLKSLGRFNFTTDECVILSDKVRESTFHKLSDGRRRGQKDQNHHFRNGLSGDWKNYFTENHKELFKERYNFTLLKYGFEQDANW